MSENLKSFAKYNYFCKLNNLKSDSLMSLDLYREFVGALWVL